MYIHRRGKKSSSRVRCDRGNSHTASSMKYWVFTYSLAQRPVAVSSKAPFLFFLVNDQRHMSLILYSKIGRNNK